MKFEENGVQKEIPVKVTVGCFVVRPSDFREPIRIIHDASESMKAIKAGRGTERK